MDLPDNAMRLAPGFGVVPKNRRNKGYDKLGFAPGEGGLGKRQDPVERMADVFAKALEKALAPLARPGKENADGS